jgi:hypothetical protein
MLLLPDIASFYELLGVTSGGRGTFDVLRVKGFPSAVKHYFRGRMWLAAIALPLAALACLVYVLGFIQVVLWLKEKHFMFVLFFLGFSEYFIFIPGPITMPRYQIPALPFLCVCAGLAATRLASWISNRRKRIS